MRSAEPTNLRL